LSKILSKIFAFKVLIFNMESKISKIFGYIPYMGKNHQSNLVLSLKNSTFAEKKKKELYVKEQTTGGSRRSKSRRHSTPHEPALTVAQL